MPSITVPYAKNSTPKSFDSNELINYILSPANGGRDYIIQGQIREGRNLKDHSLDAWLRRLFPMDRQTDLATNEVMDALIATGLFAAGKFTDPVTGKLCKGLRLRGHAIPGIAGGP